MLKKKLLCAVVGLLMASTMVFADDLNDADKAFTQGDNLKAAQLYEKACNGGDVIGCGKLAVMYYDGTRVKQDNFKAAQLYEKACNSGHAKGCGALGAMYQDGIGVKQNNQKALDFFGKACDMKNETGCSYYAKLKKQMGQ